jgi:hypothetical protein
MTDGPGQERCARGCCPSQAEHYRSIRVASPSRRSMRKVRTDDHGTHSVDVTEHWSDRQDVTVKPATVVLEKE